MSFRPSIVAVADHQPAAPSAQSPERAAIAAALAQRAEKLARIVSLEEAVARLRAAEEAEAAVTREIGALGAEEVAAMQAWAATGEGAPPRPQVEARRDLDTRLTGARAQAEAARGAAPALHAQIASARADAEAITDRLPALAFEVFIAELSGALAETAAAIIAVRRTASQAQALINRLFTESHLRRANDPESSQAQRIAQLAARTSGELRAVLAGGVPSSPEIEAQVRRFDRFLVSLRADPAATLEEPA